MPSDKNKIQSNSFKHLLRQAYDDVNPSRYFAVFLMLMFVVTALYPSDMSYYTARAKTPKEDSSIVVNVDNYLRFTNTIIQAVLPLVLMDKIGLVQAVYVGIATTVSTQTLKQMFNHVSLFGVEVGQRPSGKSGNIPSGHSSMAASAMYFIARRYGLVHLIYLVPITILTMYSRLMLDCHTLSATLSGCILGVLMAALFTSKYKKSSSSAN